MKLSDDFALFYFYIFTLRKYILFYELLQNTVRRKYVGLFKAFYSCNLKSDRYKKFMHIIFKKMRSSTQ